MAIIDEYLELKDNSDTDLLAMQVGDFYEFFAEDARVAGNCLGIKVTEKSSGNKTHPMAGVPVEDLDSYIKTLVEKNKLTVSVAEQFEKDGGGFSREIVREVTPGTILQTDEQRYLCCSVIDGDSIGMSFTDIESGTVHITECNKEDFIDELSVYEPREVQLCTTDLIHDVEQIQSEITDYIDSRVDTYKKGINFDDALSSARSSFGRYIDDIIDDSSIAVCSVAMLVSYINDRIPGVSDYIERVAWVNDSQYIRMDARTRRSLELTDTMSSQNSSCLFDVINHTVTSAGSSRLKRFIQRPLSNRDDIQDRQRMITAFIWEAKVREDIIDKLENLPSISRIATRISYGSATPREVSQLADSIETIKDIRDTVTTNSRLSQTELSNLCDNLEPLSKVHEQIRSSIVDDPPSTVSKGVIKQGYDDELDKIIEQHESVKNWFDRLENTVSDKYSLSHVTVDRNMTDGMYLQVGKSESDRIPKQEFDRIKKLKSSVRFKNEKIREKERNLLRLEEKREEIEEKAFCELLDSISEHSKIVQQAADFVAQIDAVLSLSTHTVKNGWKKPNIVNNRGVKITDGRHPVVEQNRDFVPNSSMLHDGHDFAIVTGPNMSGKSTYLRQTALIVLLAQIGSYVPAESAEIGIVDAIYTRIGAMDEISHGRSTFMIEMIELANILNNSTEDSLVVLDEVGRGTATSDGISIAQSTVEYLCDFVNPMALFATHYHSLTELAEDFDNVYNLHVAVDKSKESYNFLRKVETGAASKSYGIEVADDAGVPKTVTNRAHEILSEIRDES